MAEDHVLTRSAYGAAIGGGAALWLLTAAVSGRGEAWDTAGYWTVTYPAAILLAGGLGYWAPTRAWRWGLSVMLAQAVVLAITAADFSMLPLGLILFAILSLPAIGLAVIGAKIRKRQIPA